MGFKQVLLHEAQPLCPLTVPQQLHLLGFSMSSCSIPSNPDIAGVGVRTAIYIQVLLSFIPAVYALWDGHIAPHELQSVETQSTTTLILAFGILISCIVQAFTLGLTNFHASIVLSMSWMNNTNVFIYFLLYVQRRTQEGAEAKWSAWRRHITNALVAALQMRASDAQPEAAGEASRGARVAIFKRIALIFGSLHLTVMAALGVWLWSSPRSFGTSSSSECSVQYAHLAVLGVSIPFGAEGLRIFSLFLYSLFLIPGFNLLLPMVAFLSLYILRIPSRSSATPTIHSEDNSDGRLKSSVTPACIGLAILFAIDIVFIADIELTLRRNRVIQIRGEAEWGFGQVLAVLLLLVPLRDVIEMLLARNERQKNKQIMEELLGSMDSEKFADTIVGWLKRGVDVTTRSKDGRHTVFEALVRGRKWDQVAALVNENGVDVSEHFCDGMTALEVASTAFDWNGVAILLGLSANVNTEFTDGRTALEVAAVGKQWSLIGDLIRKGAKVNIPFKDEGMGGLLQAACGMGGPVELITSLLERGVSPDRTDTSGSTCLHLACSDGRIDCVEVLVQFNANVNARDKTGRVPLHVACSKQHRSCVKKLLDSHADPCLRDDKGEVASVRELFLTSQDDPELVGRLYRLGLSFLDQSKHTSSLPDINEAISALNEAQSRVLAGHNDYCDCLNSLGCSLMYRFQMAGNLNDVTEAISVQEALVELTPEGHGDMPVRLSHLGISFLGRFESTGDMPDVTRAITAQQRAVMLTPPGHAGLPGFLNNLGTSLAHRFERTGDMADITQAITAQQRAVQLTPQGHADLPSLLNNLGGSFTRRFERTGDMADITQAITCQQQAVQLTPQGHADLPSLLNNLGNSFTCHFERTGELADITQAIICQQQAVRLTPQGHADLPSWLNNLGNSFTRRFERTGEMADITLAITCQQRAVQLTPQGHVDLPSLLNNLGSSFTRRFERTGEMADITLAITCQQRAVQLTPQGHADLPSLLNNLGGSFTCRFEQTGEMADITQAITCQQQAVRLTPQGHADLPSWLNNLGNSFTRRFERTGEMADITQAITCQQQAVQLTPGGHADLPSLLNNLGGSFTHRFERTGEMADITQAITNRQQAVQLTPQGHADLPGLLNDLGSSFRSRFEHSKAHRTDKQMSCEDMHCSSVKCFTAATRDISCPPMLRLKCAVHWARLLMRHDPQSCDVLVPFEAAVNLLSLVAGLEWTLQSRHSQLQGFSSITLEAAAAACRLGYPGKAVEWLEQGRCLVWGQLNGLRTPMDNLHEQHPQLANRLGTIARQLELAGSTHAAVDPSMDLSAMIPLEGAVKSHLALAREWEELLSAARNLPGFQSFLLPSPCSAILQGLPELGPIVVINCQEDQCDALALLHGSDQPLHIPLPNFSLKKANQYRHLLKNILNSDGIRMREKPANWDDGLTDERAVIQGKARAHDTTVNRVLRNLWLEVAKPILDMLGYSRCDCTSVPPRLWWCLTGVASFLPIHAAGIYGAANPECVMDYVVSSYTPTVTAITDRVKRSRLVDVSASGLFLTSQPRTPGAVVIPGTTKEVEEVCAKSVEAGVKVLHCEGDDISVEDCRRCMEEFSSVHLACHATQNASDPLQSRFLLHKGDLTLLSIIQMNLNNADLAFLSACQTSAGEEKLSDEAVHLAAGMLAAGYRRVVSTMWSINDVHAPRVATDFYDYLWKNRADESRDGGFDGSLSAQALHHAIQQLRARLGDSERDLLNWVPYVHFGY